MAADAPDRTITLRVKGLPLTREPQEIDANGFGVFYLDGDKVDWTESCNRARGQIFPNQKIPPVDHRFEAIMRARAEREAAA